MLFGEKVKNKMGLLGLTLLLPSLLRNVEEQVWVQLCSVQPQLNLQKQNELTRHLYITKYGFLKNVWKEMKMKTTDFIVTLSLSLTLSAFLQYQAIHTGQSLSGAFWNGLVLSAITYLSLTSFFSEAQSGHWGITPNTHSATTHRLNSRTWPKVRTFLMSIKIARTLMCFLRRQKSNPTRS